MTQSQRYKEFDEERKAKEYDITIQKVREKGAVRAKRCRSNKKQRCVTDSDEAKKVTKERERKSRLKKQNLTNGEIELEKMQEYGSAITYYNMDIPFTMMCLMICLFKNSNFLTKFKSKSDYIVKGYDGIGSSKRSKYWMLGNSQLILEKSCWAP